jgi:CHAD domain-containing protein
MPENNFKLKGIKPALSGYISEARLMLDPAKMPDEKVVHDVRVLMKKSRASIKLLKTQMDVGSFKKEYFTFREVGRIMRSWRETSVHRKLLKDMKKRHQQLFTDLVGNEKISLLLSKPEIVHEPSPEMKSDLGNIISLLHKSGYRLRFSSMNNLDQNLLFRELEITYKAVSECYLKARNYSKSIYLHEFRKKTKDFLYQLFIFRPLDPKAIKGLEKRLESLGQNLGKYNDYAGLIKSLGYRYPSGENSSAMDELIVLIKQEQDKYLLKVWPSANRIFRPGNKLVSLPGFKVPVV